MADGAVRCEPSPKQIRQIARSIETFTFLVPVLVDGQGNVLAGLGRILAALQLGWTEVPVISVNHLSENQARAFLIADNRLTENSVWDDRLLAQHLKELSKLELDFSLEVTGIDMGEIDLRIEGLAAETDDDDPADALPTQTGPAVTSPGDQWLLGRNRAGCGNALEEDSYAALMQEEKAAMGAIRHREFAMGCGEMNSDQFRGFPNPNLFVACPLQPRWRDPLYLHGLAPYGRSSGGRSASIHRAQEPLRVGQKSHRHGSLLSS